MKKYSELFIAFDTAKKKHAVAIADVGREGEIGISARSTARRWGASGLVETFGCVSV